MHVQQLCKLSQDAEYSRKRKIQEKLEHTINVTDAVYRRKALTVDRGDALLI